MVYRWIQRLLVKCWCYALEDNVSVTVTSHDIAIAMSSSRADPVLGVIILIYWAFWRDLNIIEY